jgi:hypothetical protein
MLALGQRDDFGIDPRSLYFRDYLSRFSSRLLHRPSVAARGARVGEVRYGTATTPLRSATRETMSPIIRVTSKSFGV